MKLCWLHISDLHFDNSRQYDTDVVLRGLVKFVRDVGEQVLLKPDVIFFTGDLADSGETDEYYKATKFFGHLLAAAKLEKSRLFVIPGNHDVYRPAGRYIGRTLGSQAESDDFFSNLQLRHNWDKLRGFTDWTSEFFSGTRSVDQSTTCETSIDVIVNGLTLGIVCINTALFSQDDQDQGQLWIGRRCLDVATDVIAGYKPHIAIALIHHPVDWLSASEQTIVRDRLRTSFDFLLRGHLHGTSAEVYSNPTGQLAESAAGACYETESTPRSAVYVIVDYEVGTAELYPIRYEHDRETWTIDTSVFPHNHGRYTGTFSLRWKYAPSPHDAVSARAPEPNVRTRLDGIEQRLNDVEDLLSTATKVLDFEVVIRLVRPLRDETLEDRDLHEQAIQYERNAQRAATMLVMVAEMREAFSRATNIAEWESIRRRAADIIEGNH